MATEPLVGVQVRCIATVIEKPRIRTTGRGVNTVTAYASVDGPPGTDPTVLSLALLGQDAVEWRDRLVVGSRVDVSGYLNVRRFVYPNGRPEVSVQVRVITIATAA